MSSIPRHVAFIPDGNRRWAKAHGVSTFEGHNKGLNSFRQIMNYAADRGIEYVSVWGLSVDNLVKRAPQEVRDLIRIFHGLFVDLLDDEEIHTRKIRVRVIGKWRTQFPPEVVKIIESVEERTKDYTAYNLTVFLAYNGTDEMIEAVQTITNTAKTQDVVVTSELIKNHLLTSELPPVDLLIRTGGEPHLSAGFMMWDVADAELFFTPLFWPDFSESTLQEALDMYASRQRRFGK